MKKDSSAILKLFGFCVSTGSEAFANIESGASHWFIASLPDLVVHLDSDNQGYTKLKINDEYRRPIGAETICDTETKTAKVVSASSHAETQKVNEGFKYSRFRLSDDFGLHSCLCRYMSHYSIGI